jgi:hypothetical protein
LPLEKETMWPDRARGSRLRQDETRVLAGSADMTSADRVHDLFMRFRGLVRRGARHVIIDLREVDAADTKLVACLVALQRMAIAASVRLELCLSRRVRDVAGICRLEWLADERAVDHPVR